MGEVCVLKLVFPPNEDLDIVEKKFVESLGQEIRRGELIGGVWERYILIEQADSYFYLSKHKDDRLALFGIISSTSLSGLTGKDLFEFLNRIGDATSKLDPLFAYWEYTGSFGVEIVMESEFEYYSEPYFFCLEPVVERGDKGDDVGFLFDEKTHQKIEEIKKVMPRDELLALLEKHSKKLVLGKCGAGIIKEVGYDAYYPRYFVRKAVREKNINLPEGFTELLYYDLEFEKEPENAGKLLDIVNNNLEKISIDWECEIMKALQHAFRYKPKEAYITFQKYYLANKENLDFGGSWYKGDSVGEMILGRYLEDKEEHIFFGKMIEAGVLTQKEASELETKYTEAMHNKDYQTVRKVLREVGQHIDKKWGGLQ